MPSVSTINLKKVNSLHKGLTEIQQRGTLGGLPINFAGFSIFGFLIGPGGQTVGKSRRAIQSYREGHGVFARKGLFHLLDCHLIDVVADLTGAFMLPACYQGFNADDRKEKELLWLKEKKAVHSPS